MAESSVDIISILEAIAVVCGLAFVILIIYEKPIGWLFGIVQSVLSVVVFYSGGLISESYLYGLYAVLGVWGWITWGKRPKDVPLRITNWGMRSWAIAMVLGVLCSLSLGWLQDNFNQLAQRPYIDAFTTIFAIISTVLEIRKKLPAFVLWIVVNAVSIPLYFDREFLLYSSLMVVYLGFSIAGYVRWRRVFVAGERRALEAG